MTRFQFTPEAPGRLAGLDVEQAESFPTMEELIQLTTALDLDMPDLQRLVRENAAVSTAVAVFIALRRSGVHVTAKAVLGLTPGVHFVAVEDDGPQEAEDPQPARTTTGTGSAPDGSGRHAVEATSLPA